MKSIKHIWKYLTSSQYRMWVDWCAQKEHIDKSMNMILDNLALKSYPPFLVDDKGNIMIPQDKKRFRELLDKAINTTTKEIMTPSIKNFTEETERLFDERFIIDDYPSAVKAKYDSIKSFLRSRQTVLIDLLLEELPKEKHETPDSGETRISGAMYAMEQGHNQTLQEVKQKLLEIKKQL